MKSLGISQLVYSISNVEVPECIASTLKSKLFGFLWKNKKDKIKRLFRFGLTADYECLYCGEPDSIDHTFIQCQFSQRFIKKNCSVV